MLSIHRMMAGSCPAVSRNWSVSMLYESPPAPTLAPRPPSVVPLSICPAAPTLNPLRYWSRAVAWLVAAGSTGVMAPA